MFSQFPARNIFSFYSSLKTSHKYFLVMLSGLLSLVWIATLQHFFLEHTHFFFFFFFSLLLKFSSITFQCCEFISQNVLPIIFLFYLCYLQVLPYQDSFLGAPHVRLYVNSSFTFLQIRVSLKMFSYFLVFFPVVLVPVFMQLLMLKYVAISLSRSCKFVLC